MHQPPIRIVHLIFKTHLDVGFTDLARNVVDNYLERFIPAALEVADELRARGGPERFVWTTGAWLIHAFLEQASPEARARMERAIAAGAIAWHALPFTTHSELLDPALFRCGLELAQELDRRFDRRTVAAKMTDVPGHTRGIVPLLAEAGVRFLHIGVNPASTPPSVPPLFVWRDPAGAELLVAYQKGSYGDVISLPGLDEALAFAHTGDNLGPQEPDEIIDQFAQLRARFPGAQVLASTLDAFVPALERVRAQLPVLTAEIGDTWIHGTGSDPQKVSHFRELLRLRAAWLAQGRVQPDDPALQRFSRQLLLVAEHTWGMDEKTHLRDYTHYSATELAALRAEEQTRRFESSWDEQRGYLRTALAELGDTPLAAEARARLAELMPFIHRRDAEAQRMENEESLILHFPSSAPLRLCGETECAHFTIAFEPLSGAITRLVERATGRNWAGAEQPLALFRYETFGQAEYERFYRQYIVNKRATAEWSLDDYTKPGMATSGAEHAFWTPQLRELRAWRDAQGQRFQLELAGPEEATQKYGCPQVVTLELLLPDDEPVIQLELQWFAKRACRLPEALWLSFVPPTRRGGGWLLDKLGQVIDPRDVLFNGNRTLHAVGEGARYQDASGAFALETLDAPLIAPGAPSLLNFTNRLPAASGGVHVNLYNNIWGTNFPMWYEDDGRFRFTLRFG